jgi:hypothetical protein
MIRRNPERLAWIVLLTAFTIFCMIALLIPASIYWYVVNSTDPLLTELTSVRGIVFIDESEAELSTSVIDGNTVSLNETQKVSTNETSQAILTFSDDSSLTMYSNTELILHRAAEPRFSLSYRPTQIMIEVQQGRVRATASRDQNDLRFGITTPQTEISLGQGSFSVEVSDKGTQVVTRLGQAEVKSGENSILLRQGERIVVNPELAISPPLPAAQNLLADSTFSPLSLGNSWEPYTIEPIEGVTATVEVVLFQNQPVLRLHSAGQDNFHTEIGVTQQVNRDVRDFQSLRIFAEVRLINQSLPGGGQLGSEFPIMLHLAYTDINGAERDWFHGFYYKPPPDNYRLYDHADNSSESIAPLIWYPYESVNLLAALGPTKPAYIRSIRIYASGWIYDAMVANISLLAEE